MPLRPVNRDQGWLLPPTIDGLVPDDHPVRFVAEFVEALGSEVWQDFAVDPDGESMGAPAYDRRALLCVWLYGFMTKVRSTRKLENACREQLPFIWLTGMQQPDHNTLWRFYKENREAMRGLLKQTVRTALRTGLLDWTLQALDGTKVGANAAGERTMNAERLKRLLERTDEAIAELEAQNEAGEGSQAAHLPQALASKQALREQVRSAIASVAAEGGPKAVNLTDRDARLVRSRQGFLTGYNGQAMVSPLSSADGETSGFLITAAEVVGEANDVGQLIPMLDAAAEATGCRAETTLADAGYSSGENLAGCDERGQAVLIPDQMEKFRQAPFHKDRFPYDPATDSYTCPEGQPLRFVGLSPGPGRASWRRYGAGAVCRGCPFFGVCTRNEKHGRTIKMSPHEARSRRQRALMRGDAAKALYRQRKQLVEPVFAILKEHQAGRRFLLRGLDNVRTEWSLLAVAFNLRMLWRLSHPAPFAREPAPS